MTVLEIVFAILLILSCVFIIAVVLMQESKQGMSNVISGGSSDNYFQKNSGRTREAKLSRATKIAAVLVFVVAIAVNLITVYWGGDNSDTATTDIADNITFDTTAGSELPTAEGAEGAETTAGEEESGSESEESSAEETAATDAPEADNAQTAPDETAESSESAETVNE